MSRPDGASPAGARPAPMLPRERVIAAIERRPVDVVPLRIFPAPGGLHEHGRRLADAIRACGHDFGELGDLALPAPPPPGDFDAGGRYHAFKTDDWGTTWEYRIFGVWGHPVAWPLDDLGRLDAYRPPAPPPADGPEFERAKAAAATHRKRHFLLEGGGSLFEKLHSIRRFEDVLVDIALDTPEINRIEDLVAGHAAGLVRRALALDADGVLFGDDFGTQEALLLSPEHWRRFFKPRYRALFEPVRRAGRKIFFHCCGQVDALLEDFRDLGVDTIWPQLPAYDPRTLARRCRDLGLAVELHPDRGALMQQARPEDVRDYLLRLMDDFEPLFGGAWLYLEIDPGFPWPNVEALFRTAMDLRRTA